MSLKKAEALMRGLEERLKLRMPSTYIFSDSYDSSGNPVLSFQQDSSWATGEQKATIRIKPEENPNVNSIGQAQEGFSPHVCQMVAEESATAGKSVLSDANRDKLMREIFEMGTIVEIYLSDNADDPVVAEISALNLEERLDDLQWPLVNRV